MTLANLLKIGHLKEHQTSPVEVARLLRAASQSIADARGHTISAATRFDAAYKAVMQCSLVALMANGYRPDTKKPGHHAMVIQSLPKTLGLDTTRVAVLDTLRHKRNVTDYTGEGIDDESLRVCIEEAVRLLEDVEAWLEQNRPDLVG
jgi:hypothetical protein